MTINSTLFVQMFNFFVTYFILKYVVLRPALAILVQKRKKQLELEQKIALTRHEIEQRLQEDHRSLQEDLQKAQELVPEIVSDVEKTIPVNTVKHDCFRDGCDLVDSDLALKKIVASIRKRIEHA